jgi:hypothetical protein
MAVVEGVVLLVTIVRKRSAQPAQRARVYARSWELSVPVELALTAVWVVRCCIYRAHTHRRRQKLVLSTRGVQEEAGAVLNDLVRGEPLQVVVEVEELTASIQATVWVELKGYVREEVVEELEERIQEPAVHEQAMLAAGAQCQRAYVKLEEAWAVSSLSAAEALVSIQYQTWSGLM